METKKKQQLMEWCNNDRLQQGGKAGSKFHRLYECVAHKRIRLDMASHSNEQQAKNEWSGKGDAQ